VYCGRTELFRCAPHRFKSSSQNGKFMASLWLGNKSDNILHDLPILAFGGEALPHLSKNHFILGYLQRLKVGLDKRQLHGILFVDKNKKKT